MNLYLRILFFWLLLLGTVAVVTPSRAATKLTLTPEIKQHLMSLGGVEGRNVERAAFDGRPVLIKFFASW